MQCPEHTLTPVQPWSAQAAALGDAVGPFQLNYSIIPIFFLPIKTSPEISLDPRGEWKPQ